MFLDAAESPAAPLPPTTFCTYADTWMEVSLSGSPAPSASSLVIRAEDASAMDVLVVCARARAVARSSCGTVATVPTCGHVVVACRVCTMQDPYWQGPTLADLPGFTAKSSTALTWLTDSLSVGAARDRLSGATQRSPPVTAGTTGAAKTATTSPPPLPSGGLLVVGPDGSGKTSFVRALCHAVRTDVHTAASSVRRWCCRMC